MGTERRNYVMTVGLAMQREMAYRHKLHNLTTQRLASTSQLAPKPTPYSVPTRSYSGPRPGHPRHPRPNVWFRGSVPGIMTVPRPQFQGPYPRPCPPSGPHSTIGQKRKQPLQGESHFCDLCQIDCSNAFNLKMHLKGQKHMAKLNGTEVTKTTAASETRVTAQSEWIHCGLCNIWCSSEITLSQHVNGKNHITKLRASEQS